MRRALEPAWRTARLFQVGDEIRRVGEPDWLRIVEIHAPPGRRQLILAPHRECYAEGSMRFEHRRMHANRED